MTVLGVDALARIPPASFPRTVLAFIPALRILTLEFDVLPVWRALERGEVLRPPRRCAGAVVVWRRVFDVFHVAIPPDEARALALALEHKTMAEVCACFGDRPDGAARVAFDAIGSWAKEGMIMGVRPGRPPRRSRGPASRS